MGQVKVPLGFEMSCALETAAEAAMTAIVVKDFILTRDF
jgi:hypothetical protein